MFNPPWVQGEVGGMLDRALYFEAGLFERFFDLAVERLAPDGRIALVFSDLIRLVQPDLPHPIEVEFERGRLELVQKLRRKVPPTTTREGKRLRTKERVEVWELKAS